MSERTELPNKCKIKNRAFKCTTNDQSTCGFACGAVGNGTCCYWNLRGECMDRRANLDAAQTRIAELEAANKELVGAMIHCIESIRSIKWGYDGDGGAWNAVEVMDDKLAEIQSKANGGENT